MSLSYCWYDNNSNINIIFIEKQNIIAGPRWKLEIHKWYIFSKTENKNKRNQSDYFKGRICRESCENFCSTFTQNVAEIKDTYRENTLSNKTQGLTKSTNIDTSLNGTLNQLSIKGFNTRIKVLKKSS